MNINYVWLSKGPLPHDARFNVYLWRYYKVEVNLYVTRLGGITQFFDEESLGLSAVGGVHVHDLLSVLKDDGQQNVGMPNTRQTIMNWGAALKKRAAIDEFATYKDHLYNVGDLAKSYLCGTRPGITLDAKMGPSEHFGAFTDYLTRYFVGSDRGKKSTTGIENSLMGSFGWDSGLRQAYATAFDKKVQENLAGAKQDGKHFDNITNWHGRAITLQRKVATDYRDICVENPKDGPKGSFKVSEPGGTSHGPIRVLKAEYEQSNLGTRHRDSSSIVKSVCNDALRLLRPATYEETQLKQLAQKVVDQM